MSGIEPLILGGVGAAIGWTVGETLLAAQIGWAVGSAIGASAFAPTVRQEGPKLADLKVTGVEYGQPIPYLIGAMRLPGQLWWASDKRAIAHTTTSGGGKGGGGGEVEQTTYTYEVDVLYGLTDNEAQALTRVWANGELVYSALDPSSDTADFLYGSSAWGAGVLAQLIADLTSSNAISATTTKWQRLTFYPGTATQVPDSTYEAAVGSTLAPAYRGRASVFIQGLDLGPSGQIPQLTFEVLTDSVEELATWTSQTAASAQQWRDVCWSPELELFVAVASNGPPYVMTSPDGITWTGRTAQAGSWNSVAWSSELGMFAAVGADYTGQGVMTSADGVNWTLGSSIPNNSWTAVCVGEGGWFVAVGADIGYTQTMYSSNGSVWTAVASAEIVQWRDVCYATALDLYVAVARTGTAAQQVMTSTSPIGPWTARTAAQARSWQGVAWSPELGLLVAVADDGAGGSPTDTPIMTSADGISWTPRQPEYSTTWHEVEWAAEAATFVALASTGHPNATMFSEDGITWTTETSPANVNWEGVAWSPTLGRFVAVASNGSAATQVATKELAATSRPATITVQDAVERLCARADFAATQYDASALASITTPLRGLALTQIGATRQALELLMTTFHFEMYVSDKIYFVPRGGTSVATIPYADLGAAEDGVTEFKPLTIIRRNDIESPAQTAITYANITDDYQTDTQFSDRQISAQETVSAMQIPIAMTPLEAKALADAVLWDVLIAQTGTSISVTADYAELIPTDVVTLTDADGATYRMRIVKREDAFPLIKFDCVMDDASILVADGAATSSDYAPGSVVAAAANTVLRVLDIPILRDEDDNAGIYVAACGDADPWPGYALLVSEDDVIFTNVATVANAAACGTCTTTLGAWTGGRVFDMVNTVTVNVGVQTLSSATRSEIIADSSVNACAIGNDANGWELIQYLTATLVSTGVYTLSGLLRGCRGTEWMMARHVASEQFAMLSTTGLRRVSMSTTDLGDEDYYRGVTLGQAQDSATSQTATNNGVGLKPFAPYQLRLARDPVSGDINITARRRTRYATRWVGALGPSCPVGEDSESYECDIVALGSPDTVVRTLPGSSLSFTYTAAQQTTDFGSPTPGTFRVRVYQLSATVERGYAKEVTA